MDKTQFEESRQRAIEAISFYSHEHNLQKRFLEKYQRWKEPFYSDDNIDPDKELKKIYSFLKSNPTDDTIRKRITELTGLKLKKKWFGKWFKNTIFDKEKEKTKTQYVYHSNPIWKWYGFPETISCDTIFITFENDESTLRVKKFDDMLFNLNHADTWYKEVKSKGIINKLNHIVETL